MKEKKYLVLGITLILLTFVGVSLAYFLITVEGERKNITINTADLRVIFTNGDAIEGTEIEPGWSVTKTFSVENKTKNEYKYNIVIEDLVNTFKTTGYLQYKITSTDGGYNMDGFKDVPKSLNPTNTGLAFNITIPAKSTQNYSIIMQYKNDENVDQSRDGIGNSVVTGKLYITEGTNPTLSEVILRDNPTISERTDFSVTNTATTTGTIYQTDKTEDRSTIYYYSGNTTNNWVKFGKELIQECTYNGEQVQYVTSADSGTLVHIKPISNESECLSTNVCIYSVLGPGVGLSEEECIKHGGTWTSEEAIYAGQIEKDIYWRIIRTNENGSVRLLYSGNAHDTTGGHIGSQGFNIGKEPDFNINDPIYAGYMYGTSGTLENNRTNENSSLIKKYIDNWYEKNLLINYDKYISKSAIYCNDRSVPNNNYSLTSKFNFASVVRSYINLSPSNKCGADANDGLFESTQAIADKFSASTEGGGNGQLKYPIALMTADEVIFAGGLFDKPLNSPYAWYYTNSNGESIISRFDWLLLTPNAFSNSNVYNITVSIYNNSKGLSTRKINFVTYIRPVTSLSPCVKIKSGQGTPDDPYVVDYDNSCN